MSARKHLLKLCLLSALGSPLAALAEPTYSITFLPSFGTVDINNRGQIAGTFSPAPFIDHAALWTNGTLADLGSLSAGGSSYATALNAKGAVTGYSETGIASHAFVYSGGTMRDIGTLGGSSSFGYDINASGKVVGDSLIAAEVVTHRAFLYENGTMHNLGTLGGGFSAAHAINDAGVVVGTSTITGGEELPYHAFIYRDGTMMDLGTLEGGTYSQADEINNAGLIAGVSNGTGFDSLHVFIYADGVMTDVGSFGGETYVEGINNLGQVVGASGAGFGTIGHGFLYTGGQLVDLNTLIDPALGWTVTSASGINDAGQITATVVREGSLSRTVRLDLIAAIPEPETYAMLLAGLALVSWRRRPQGAACRHA